MLRTIAILRGRSTEDSARLAKMCWEIGIDLVEVTVQGDLGWSSLAAVVAEAGNRQVGAGTVLSAADVERAVEMGASVIISPHVASDVVKTAASLGVTCVPGVMTATEVARAKQMNVSLCKLFPANIVGSGMAAALHGPFPDVDFVAVGGVDPTNAMGFIEGGATGVAFGSSLEDMLALRDPAAFVRRIYNTLEALHQ